MRQELRIEKPKEPDDLAFSGLPLDYDTAMLSYRAYREHGALPFAGGTLDQPMWWWDMIELIDQIYHIRWYENKDEAEAAAKRD